MLARNNSFVTNLTNKVFPSRFTCLLYRLVALQEKNNVCSSITFAGEVHLVQKMCTKVNLKKVPLVYCIWRWPRQDTLKKNKHLDHILFCLEMKTKVQLNFMCTSTCKLKHSTNHITTCSKLLRHKRCKGDTSLERCCSDG